MRWITLELQRETLMYSLAANVGKDILVPWLLPSFLSHTVQKNDNNNNKKKGKRAWMISSHMMTYLVWFYVWFG